MPSYQITDRNYKLKISYLLEHGLDVSSDQRKEEGRTQTGGYQVEQSGLGVTEYMHN